jgi:dephospho-CoA kinase
MSQSIQPAPFRVGLTGGIASGKTTVARLFEALGTPVIDTDVLARDVVAPGQPVLQQIVARFGPQVLSAEGSLDRAALRAIVFADPAARRELEQLTHPAIRALLEERSAALGGEYQILVIPLLIETGRRTPVDRVLVVDVPEELQIRRVQARDGSTAAQAKQILSAQVSRETRLAAADDVIVNDGSLGALRDRVAELHVRYRSLAAATRGLRARQAPT